MTKFNFLPLTSAVSPPFIPSSLDTLRKEYQAKPSTENAVSDTLADPIAESFRQEKDRALSDVSDLGLSYAEPLHTRANSSTSDTA